MHMVIVSSQSVLTKLSPGACAELANGSSSGTQLPAVAQLQLPSSQPNQAAAALSQQTLAQAHEALMQHSSLAAAAGNPAAAAAAGGNVELPASSGPSHGFGQLLGSSSGLGQGQILPSAGMQEHPTAKQQMLQAIYDGTAVAQVGLALIPITVFRSSTPMQPGWLHRLKAVKFHQRTAMRQTHCT